MNRFLLTVLLGGFILGALHSQPLPCTVPAEMTSFCDEACIICDIDGFEGINNSTLQGQMPIDFCTTNQNHLLWIAFQAGSTNLTLNVAVSNCTQNDGLEIGIYYSDDCLNFTKVSNCDDDVPENTSQNFTNIVPLIIGQYYYFVMDGNGGDVCHYDVTVVSGNTIVTPLTTSGEISGQLELCPGLTQSYTTTGQEGATTYQWTVDGTIVSTEQTFDLALNTLGTHELCVVASNVCDIAPASCVNLHVTAVQPTTINGSICSNETFIAAGDTIDAAGTYQYTFQSALGCDSLVTVNVVQLPASFTNFSVDICDGDTLMVAGLPFTTAGNFQEIVPNWVGCDSTITFDLGLIVCEINVNEAATNVACNGGNTGSLSFYVQSGTPPFTYDWQQLGTGLTGSGNITALSETITIPNLAVGTYVVTVNNNFGEDAVAILTIQQPPQLAITFDPTQTNGYEVTCAGGNDGTIAATATGGVPNYTFAWSDGSTNSTLTDAIAGTYILTVTDASNCTLTNAYTTTEPTPLNFSPIYTDANCGGLATGIIQIPTATGGVSPYHYAFEDGVFADDTLFTGLTPDIYHVAVIDSNGCVTLDSGLIVAPIIPTVYLPDTLTIDLADSIGILTLADGVDSIIWTGINLSCYDCIEPIASPVWSGGYTVTVISEDDCVAVDSVYIVVNKIRKVFVPNAFSNNDDGTNDWFTVFAGPQVRIVKEFRVFDRWGELLFENFNFEPNEEAFGWNGDYRGKKLINDVFVWYAVVEFIDGIIIRYEGDVSIIK